MLDENQGIDIQEGQEEAFNTDELGMTEKAQIKKTEEDFKSGEIKGITADRLRGFIERIERLEEEKKALADDIKEVYAESKSLGFQTKIMRKVVSLRKLGQEERMEQEELTDVYKHALGME